MREINWGGILVFLICIGAIWLSIKTDTLGIIIETILKAIWWLIKTFFELLKKAIVAIVGSIILLYE